LTVTFRFVNFVPWRRVLKFCLTKTKKFIFFRNLFWPCSNLVIIDNRQKTIYQNRLNS
jgi:hypothetical protein